MNADVTSGPTGIEIRLTFEEAEQYVAWHKRQPYDVREPYLVGVSLGSLIENTVESVRPRRGE